MVGDDECSLIAAFSSSDFMNVFRLFTFCCPIILSVRSSWWTTCSSSWQRCCSPCWGDSPWDPSRSAPSFLETHVQSSSHHFLRGTISVMKHHMYLFCDQTSHTQHIVSRHQSILWFITGLSSFSNHRCDHNWHYTQDCASAMDGWSLLFSCFFRLILANSVNHDRSRWRLCVKV